jgi:hypothetical protein
MRRSTPDPDPAREPAPADLQSQLESLLDEVWRAEAEWRLDDRIDLGVKVARRPRP